MSTSAGRDVVQHFQRNFGVRSSVLRLSFDEALGVFKDGNLKFDLVYIDGYAHAGQEGGSTLERWFSMVAPGGMLAGHDYDLQHWPLTYHKVNVFANKYGLTVRFTDACNDFFPSWYVIAPDEDEGLEGV